MTITSYKTRSNRKNDDAQIIEEWVLNNKDKDVSQPKIMKKIVRPSIVKKEFVKSKQQEKTARTTVKQVENPMQNTYSPRDYEEGDGGYVAFGGNPKTGLGHLNFKTMNKLVKGNLVRGLPSKLFENDQTCVACQKGKQYRASFVTDDYSRFTWVFFLATKDETSGILKSFITRIENLVDHKVKVIRCDDMTEFKNKEMNQFCEMKVILRKFSVARTPQQNGVVKRRNMTLIEASRTMLAVLNPKSSHDDGSKPLSDDEKKVNEDPRKESKCKDQEKDDNIISTNNVNIVSSMVNAAGTNKVNGVGGKISNELPFDPNMPALENFKVKTISTPMETRKPILKDEDGEEVDVHMYRLMIGSLMYLTSLRSDIMFAVCACARYQVNPKVLHLHVVKKDF
nr:putative ribonuclease H-like domain-containing protein [Tanacetum cinerariifolium]